MSELSTDALHMTSPLRTGRRVGRHLYAQLGPEPSDDDPAVGTVDSPVLAERIVRAVNAAAPVAGHRVLVSDGLGESEWQECDGDESCSTCHPPVAREGTASPGETLPATDPGYDRVGTIRIAPGCDPAEATSLRVIAIAGSSPHHIRLTGPDTAVTENGGDRWSDAAVSSWRIQPWSHFALAVRHTAPARPAVAPEGGLGCAPRGSRDPLADRMDAEARRHRDEREEAAEAPDTKGAAPTRDALVDAFKAHEVVQDEDVDDAVVWARPCVSEAERMADVALGVLRGGGADGGRIAGLRYVLSLPDEWSSGEVLDAARVWIAANVKKEPQTETREPSGQCDVCLAPLYNVCARLDDGGKACSARCVDLARLARAAGVSPDSEDPVGAIEAAIRAGRVEESQNDKGPQALTAEEAAIADLRCYLGLPKWMAPSVGAAEAEARDMIRDTASRKATATLRPDVLAKDAKWHERTDHSGTAIAIWLSEDAGAVWVTEDGEIAALSRYSGHYVSEWHGEAITAAHRWREDEMPVSRGEVVSGKRAENAPHGTTLVRVDRDGRALAGSSVIETDGGFNGSPTGRYRVLDLPKPGDDDERVAPKTPDDFAALIVDRVLGVEQDEEKP